MPGHVREARPGGIRVPQATAGEGRGVRGWPGGGRVGVLCRVLALVGWAGLLGAPSSRLASDLPEVEGTPLEDAPPCTSSPCLTAARL